MSYQDTLPFFVLVKYPQKKRFYWFKIQNSEKVQARLVGAGVYANGRAERRLFRKQSLQVYGLRLAKFSELTVKRQHFRDSIHIYIYF